MKIEILSEKVICSNESSMHSYFAWPSVARLKNGKLAMTASGFRVGHICPFGKCVISFSEDEGETWSNPTPVIDTPLDDRDGGVVPFGESSVLVTSFNNNIQMQREYAAPNERFGAYINAYLDLVEQMDWEKYVGSTYRISHDNGRTFGELGFIPVNTPHGPTPMADGSLLYVGRVFTADNSYSETENHLACYKLYADGSWEFLSEIENVPGYIACEPYAVVLEDGTILVHLRVDRGVFTIFQCESYDGGRSFTKPHRILPERGGAPAHIIADGSTLISVYGYRSRPYGIRAMFSKDRGKTWDIDHVLVDNAPSPDMGYPASVIRKDGSILTVYYTRENGFSGSVIKQVVWRYREDG